MFDCVEETITNAFRLLLVFVNDVITLKLFQLFKALCAVRSDGIAFVEIRNKFCTRKDQKKLPQTIPYVIFATRKRKFIRPLTVVIVVMQN